MIEHPAPGVVGRNYVGCGPRICEQHACAWGIVSGEHSRCAAGAFDRCKLRPQELRDVFGANGTRSQNLWRVDCAVDDGAFDAHLAWAAIEDVVDEVSQVGTDMLFEMIPAYLDFFGFPAATADELRRVANISY